MAMAEPLTVRALLPPDQNISNEEMTLALPHENIHWFDVESGDSLVRKSE
jgi:multiple sugar transport system ATP-binding protein